MRTAINRSLTKMSCFASFYDCEMIAAFTKMSLFTKTKTVTLQCLQNVRFLSFVRIMISQSSQNALFLSQFSQNSSEA